MPILTVIDATGIQRYIFGSNRLRESIGASEIVARATSLWVLELLRELKHADGKDWQANLKNVGDVTDRSHPFEHLDTNACIENGLDAELIYAGGGNTLILFQSRPLAEEFATQYTKRLLARAPGLEIVLAQSDEFNTQPGDCAIREQNEKVMQRINQKKVNRKLSAPLLGLAVTAQCVSTGGVALFNPLAEAKGDEELRTLLDKYENNYVSAETIAKLRAVKIANERLQRDLLTDSAQWQRVRNDWRYDENKNEIVKPHKRDVAVPFKFDNLGRTEGEASFIAVVHTDGNGMGNRLKEHGKKAANSREWITVMRELSESIYNANLTALRSMMDLSIAHVEKGKDEGGKERLFVVDARGERFALSEEKRKQKGEEKNFSHLPIRPLIFGGEDVAFVCDGRVALALTVFYLQQMEKQTLKDGQPPYTRAGVAIVKAHYPFARAYSLAEELAGSAKERINEIDEKNKQVSALDWHLAMTGLAGGIGEIREREYEVAMRDKNGSLIDDTDGNVKKGTLAMRPVSLRGKNTTDWFVWEDFGQVIKEFQEEWRGKRNKVKALREALRHGADKTKEFLALTNTQLPEMKHNTGIKNSGGWHGDRCGYFDAIEMMDIFSPLDEAKLGGGEDKMPKREDRSE